MQPHPETIDVVIFERKFSPQSFANDTDLCYAHVCPYVVCMLSHDYNLVQTQQLVARISVRGME